jgi:hypothetical protein
VDSVMGIAITDRASFSLEYAHYIKDVMLIGAWHGNNDGTDFTDDCLIEDCFLVAHDDNLKLNNNTHARHVVIWQLQNAHPIMVKEMRDDITFSNCIVEDVDIVAFFVQVWGNQFQRLSSAAIASNNGRNIRINNFTFRNIRIESPFMYRLFSFFNLDTNQPYAPVWLANAPSSETRHTRIDGITMENITVNSPMIMARSLIGSDYRNSMANLSFNNISMNGTYITNENVDEYVEIEYDKIQGLSFQGEVLIGVDEQRQHALSVYPNPTEDYVRLLSGESFGENAYYQLFDVTGKLVDSERITEEETIIRTGHLASGLYFLQVTGGGQPVRVTKVVKN